MPEEEENQLDMLHELIDHCIRIKELSEKTGSDHIKQLIELLMLEAGRQFSEEMRRAGGVRIQ